MPPLVESSLIESFISRADLADLALFIWASAASALVLKLLRELAAANHRFDAFVRELHRSGRYGGGCGREL
jgi:hypothetical protein